MTAKVVQTSRPLRWLAWLPLLASVILLLLVAVVYVSLYAPADLGVPERLALLPTAYSSLGFGILCGLIITRQPRNRIGWLCGLIALATVLVSIPYVAVDYVNLTASPNLDFSYVIWLSQLGGLVISLEFLLLPLWFPDGQFLSAGWRRFAVVFYALLILSTVGLAVWPGTMMASGSSGQTTLDNPFALPFTPSSNLTRLAQVFYFITLVGGVLIAQFSLLARWRRSEGPARQQLKVLAFCLVAIGVIYMPFQLLSLLLAPNVELTRMFGGWLYTVLLVLLWAGYPIAVGVAVLKYRMYDVDIVIRKTLQYAMLTAMLALVYFASIALLQGVITAVSGRSSAVVIVLSTLAIAALFSPLRRRIQDFIDRRFYRRKYDAEQVLARFAQTARDETDLDSLTVELASVVQETMQPERVSVWLRSPSTANTRSIER